MQFLALHDPYKKRYETCVGLRATLLVLARAEAQRAQRNPELNTQFLLHSDLGAFARNNTWVSFEKRTMG
jgi:hypothetical protein